jgi:hypothetical protein
VSWPRRIAAIVTAAALAVAIGVIVAVVIVKRMRTGRWQLPARRDLAEVGERVAARIDGPPPVPRVIFLDPRPGTITPGVDDAAAGSSSVVMHQGDAPRALPGWKGTAKAWRQLTACVAEAFAPFAVTVTDQAPATREHVRVMVGGKPRDIGVGDKQVAGLAPFSGEVIPRAIVFAFAAAQGHSPRPVCETIAMEVAHAYGLDHQYLCKDFMTYLTPCGRRRFVDQDAPCGEKKPRPCAGGAANQNSYRKLLAAVGSRPPSSPPPSSPQPP